MRTLELSTASKSLSAYANDLDDEVVVLTSGKKAVAALVSLRHVDRETLALSANPEFMSLIRRARREFKAGHALSLDAMRRAVQTPAKSARTKKASPRRADARSSSPAR